MPRRLFDDRSHIGRAVTENWLGLPSVTKGFVAVQSQDRRERIDPTIEIRRRAARNAARTARMSTELLGEVMAAGAEGRLLSLALGCIMLRRDEAPGRPRNL